MGLIEIGEVGERQKADNYWICMTGIWRLCYFVYFAYGKFFCNEKLKNNTYRDEHKYIQFSTLVFDHRFSSFALSLLHKLLHTCLVVLP